MTIVCIFPSVGRVGSLGESGQRDVDLATNGTQRWPIVAIHWHCEAFIRRHNALLRPSPARTRCPFGRPIIGIIFVGYVPTGGALCIVVPPLTVSGWLFVLW